MDAVYVIECRACIPRLVSERCVTCLVGRSACVTRPLSSDNPPPEVQPTDFPRSTVDWLQAKRHSDCRNLPANAPRAASMRMVSDRASACSFSAAGTPARFRIRGIRPQSLAAANQNRVGERKARSSAAMTRSRPNAMLDAQKVNDPVDIAPPDATLCVVHVGRAGNLTEPSQIDERVANLRWHVLDCAVTRDECQRLLWRCR